MSDKKLKVLILTAKYGMGHYMVAKSIKQEIEKKVDVEVVDFFEKVFPKTQKIIYGTFNFLVKNCNSIYNACYKLTASTNCPRFNAVLRRKVEKLIEESKPDIIVSTFPVCSKYISAYIKKNDKNIKFYTYITDIEANKEWVSDETDFYFVASNETKKQIMNYGILESKIKVVGIPVRDEFRNLELKKQKNEILIMGGGLGLIPNMKNTLKELLKNDNVHITLMSGKNKKLFNKYNNKYKNLSVIGYTEEIYKYIARAEIILTKAGGITLFESIYSKTPLFILNPFLSQEKGNAKFIEKNKIGIVMWENTSDISKEILKLLEEENKLDIMRRNMKDIANKLNKINILDIYKGEIKNVC